jgi:endonuclease-3
MRNLESRNEIIVKEIIKHYLPKKRKKLSPFQVLILTILSQRTKDEITSKVGERLFKKYHRIEDFEKLQEKALANLIYGVAFPTVKAKHIIEIVKIIKTSWKGKVVDDFKKLISLPGVGPKTANCVLAYGFNKPALPVDTHLHRIANRLKLVTTSTPQETENKLKQIIPKKLWAPLSSSMVEFGKKICKPIAPRCIFCILTKICPQQHLSCKYP